MRAIPLCSSLRRRNGRLKHEGGDTQSSKNEGSHIAVQHRWYASVSCAKGNVNVHRSPAFATASAFVRVAAMTYQVSQAAAQSCLDERRRPGA